MFFKKNKIEIVSPVSGVVKDISDCHDAIFSNKLLGSGFIVEPKENTICSPCDGRVTMIYPTLHAFGIKTKNDDEILVHIGIETVNLNRKYFKQIALLNAKVKKGDPVIDADINSLKEKGYDPTIVVILFKKGDIENKKINQEVNVGDLICELS